MVQDWCFCCCTDSSNLVNRCWITCSSRYRPASVGEAGEDAGDTAGEPLGGPGLPCLLPEGLEEVLVMESFLLCSCCR